MQPLAVALILVSAVAHVYWNLQVKRSPAPAVYTCCLMAVGALLFAPLALWLSWPPVVPAAGWFCVGDTAVLYAAYFTLIAQSYRRGDLSRAYPIARGVAPVATAAWGVLFYHEHPTPRGWLGIAAIGAGAVVLAWPAFQRGKNRASLPAILAAVGTGLCTSGYSAVDKAGVRHVHPALYIVLTYGAGALAQSFLLWPGRSMRERLAEARRSLGDGAGAVPRFLLAAATAMGSYLLILFVFRWQPLSYVVPLRSVSVLLSVFAGAHFLRERGGWPTFVASGLILLGICAIAWPK